MQMFIYVADKLLRELLEAFALSFLFHPIFDFHILFSVIFSFTTMVFGLMIPVEHKMLLFVEIWAFLSINSSCPKLQGLVLLVVPQCL